MLKMIANDYLHMSKRDFVRCIMDELSAKHNTNMNEQEALRAGLKKAGKAMPAWHDHRQLMMEIGPMSPRPPGRPRTTTTPRALSPPPP